MRQEQKKLESLSAQLRAAGLPTPWSVPQDENDHWWNLLSDEEKEVCRAVESARIAIDNLLITWEQEEEEAK